MVKNSELVSRKFMKIQNWVFSWKRVMISSKYKQNVKLAKLPGFWTFYRWLHLDLSDLVFWNHSFSKHWATHSGRTWCPDAPRKNKIKSISIWYPSHYFTKKSICTLQFLSRSFSFFSLRLTKVLRLLSVSLSLHKYEKCTMYILFKKECI